MSELEELEIELSAVEGAMDRAEYRVEWEKLKAVMEKIRAKILDVKGIDSDPPRKGSR